MKDKFPYNLMKDLDVSIHDIIAPTDEVVNEVLETLQEREQDIILKHYKYGMSIANIANEYNVCRQRLYQIKNKALRKLRHPSRLDKLIQCRISKYDLDKLIKEVQDLKRLLTQQNDSSVLIEDMDFSIRTFNCLKRAKICNVDDILNVNLYTVRNLGRKSLNEIVAKMKDLGYSEAMKRYEVGGIIYE